MPFQWAAQIVPFRLYGQQSIIASLMHSLLSQITNATQEQYILPWRCSNIETRVVFQQRWSLWLLSLVNLILAIQMTLDHCLWLGLTRQHQTSLAISLAANN